ncbi:alpha/beta hydrolase [Bosea sp. (in: a-proteobacteria)]|jgi:phospholipase/carboxylesterase|uniref:Alpha/beta hydrolase n=1 Tax=Bosea vestrisii TaxID=151416 RepID=A0ABW0H4M6_9HYPH|nr:alpha/beta hydrolase [Bosea sp. (in: a-proteobacteria)]MBR3194789.1 alpha/beta hydrolase [Bosea sp. (in: a-proteobacteria)]
MTAQLDLKPDANAYHYFAKPAAPGAPLVFAFHGTGGDERQLSSLVSQIAPPAGIIAPRGDVSEHGAARFFRRTGEGIYDMADLAERTRKMIGFVRAHRAANPGAKVYGIGYSNGANILASVIFAAPELFDRVVLMHPLIPFEPAPQPGLSTVEVLITAGQRDPISPAALTEQLERWLTGQGAGVETVWHPGGHEMREAEIVAAARFLAA